MAVIGSHPWTVSRVSSLAMKGLCEPVEDDDFDMVWIVERLACEVKQGFPNETVKRTIDRVKMRLWSRI
jgi:hypothetical protein